MVGGEWSSLFFRLSPWAPEFDCAGIADGMVGKYAAQNSKRAVQARGDLLIEAGDTKFDARAGGIEGA